MFTFDCPATVTVATVAFVIVVEPLTAVTVIVVVPCFTAVNRPVELLIVPFARSLLVHVNEAPIGALFWSSGVAENCCELPSATVGFNGEIVTAVNTPGWGVAITVTAALFVFVTEPFTAVTVMVVVPTPAAVKSPLASMVPTVVSLLVQVMVAAIALPFWSFGAAVNVCVPPTNTLAVDGVTIIVVNTGTGAGAVAVTVVVPLLNPVFAAVAVIVPGLGGFTDIATLPAALDVPLPVAAPIRVTVAPSDGACTFLTLLDSLTAKDTLVDDPVGTEVGFAATANLNTGYE